jgi:hypothetical protein
MECEEDINNFLSKEKSLKEFGHKIDYLKEIINKIENLPAKRQMNLYLVDCTVLNDVIMIVF